jgi:hypothetical protein
MQPDDGENYSTPEAPSQRLCVRRCAIFTMCGFAATPPLAREMAMVVFTSVNAPDTDREQERRREGGGVAALNPLAIHTDFKRRRRVSVSIRYSQ